MQLIKSTKRYPCIHPPTSNYPQRSYASITQYIKPLSVQIRESITERISELLIQSPDLPHQPLMDLNTQAARWLKNGDSISAAAIYTILFNRAATNNITHPELYVCHSNCSAANLKLELFEEALKHAEKCRQLAERSLRRNYKASSGYIKSFERKGKALMGLSRHREAAAAFEAGLQLDAMHAEMKKGLQEANQKMLEDLIDGMTLWDLCRAALYHSSNWNSILRAR